MSEINKLLGQGKLKEQVRMIIKDAVEKTQKIFSPVLFMGPAGFGKTSFAEAMAKDMNCRFVLIHGSTVKEPHQLMELVRDCSRADIIFIDEIHRLPDKCQEILYAIIDCKDITYTQWGHESTFRMPMVNVIGATTDENLLLKPLHSRFTFKIYMEKYYPYDICSIIRKECQNLKLDIWAIDELAKATKLVPRNAINLCKFIKIYCSQKDKLDVTMDDAHEILELMGLNALGLTKPEQRYIEILSKSKRPISKKQLAIMIGVNEDTLTSVIEPFFIQNDIVTICSKGRMINANSISG